MMMMKDYKNLKLNKPKSNKLMYFLPIIIIFIMTIDSINF